MNYRPKGSNGPPYSPERDLAHITPTLMRAAMERLDRDNWTPEVAQFVDAGLLTSEVINQTVAAFADAQNYFVTSRQPVSSPEEALERTGFNKMPYNAQLLVFAQVGAMMTAGWFQGVRDVTHVGDEPIPARELSELVALGRTIGRRGVPLDAEKILLVIPEEAEFIRLTEALSHAKAGKEFADELRLTAERETRKESLARSSADEQVRVLQTQVKNLKARTIWSFLTEWLFGTPDTA